MGLLAFIATSSCDGGGVDADGGARDAAGSCGAAFLGDPGRPPVIEAFYLGADGADHPLEDGGTIDLVEPPQGGRVVLVGARASNVDPCAVQLRAAVRDPDTGLVRLDARTVRLRDEGDGFGRGVPAELADYANVPICPNSWTDRDVFDAAFTLEIELRDAEGREASASMMVRPRCTAGAGEARCRCICAGGYELGDACPDPS